MNTAPNKTLLPSRLGDGPRPTASRAGKHAHLPLPLVPLRCCHSEARPSRVTLSPQCHAAARLGIFDDEIEAVQPGHGRHEAEPQSTPRGVAAPLCAIEAPQDCLALLCGNARSSIGHDDAEIFIRTKDAQCYPAPRWRELDRIVHEAPDRLAQQTLITGPLGRPAALVF